MAWKSRIKVKGRQGKERELNGRKVRIIEDKEKGKE